MANITDQFVTSFSELHINAAKVANNISDTAIRDFFGNSVDTDDSNTTAVIINGATVAIPAGSTDEQTLLVTDTTGTDLVFTYDGALISTAVYTTVDALVTALSTNGTFVSAQVPLVMEIGTLSNEATVIDTPIFGEAYKGKLRGQLDGGQLDSQLYWAPKNFVHSFLRDLSEEGTPLSVGIKWNSDATSNADSEYVVFNSFVSSFGIDTTFDDVAKVSATLVVDGREHFASAS